MDGMDIVEFVVALSRAAKMEDAMWRAFASSATDRLARMPTGNKPNMVTMQKAKIPRAITVSIRLKACVGGAFL